MRRGREAKKTWRRPSTARLPRRSKSNEPIPQVCRAPTPLRGNTTMPLPRIPRQSRRQDTPNKTAKFLTGGHGDRLSCSSGFPGKEKATPLPARRGEPRRENRNSLFLSLPVPLCKHDWWYSHAPSIRSKSQTSPFPHLHRPIPWITPTNEIVPRDGGLVAESEPTRPPPPPAAHTFRLAQASAPWTPTREKINGPKWDEPNYLCIWAGPQFLNLGLNGPDRVREQISCCARPTWKTVGPTVEINTEREHNNFSRRDAYNIDTWKSKLRRVPTSKSPPYDFLGS